MIVTLEFGNDGTDIKARDHLFVFHFIIMTKSIWMLCLLKVNKFVYTTYDNKRYEW